MPCDTQFCQQSLADAKDLCVTLEHREHLLSDCARLCLERADVGCGVSGV